MQGWKAGDWMPPPPPRLERPPPRCCCLHLARWHRGSPVSGALVLVSVGPRVFGVTPHFGAAPDRPPWVLPPPPPPQVRALKEKIEAEKGSDAFPVAGQKLIYAGKILSDDVPIREYRIDEKNFVVVMVTKVRHTPHTPPLEIPPHPSKRDPSKLPPPLSHTPSLCRPSLRWAPQPPRPVPVAPRSLPRHQGPPRPLTPSPRHQPPPARRRHPRTSLHSPSQSPQQGKGGQKPKGGVGGVSFCWSGHRRG